MAAGRVLTGFSNVWIANYSASGTTVTYSSGKQLARGVSVSISPTSSEGSPFWADNVHAEDSSTRFTGGTGTFTVDGLKDDAEKMAFGLPTASSVTVGSDTVDVYDYGDAVAPPYLGAGYIERYMEDGVESFVPVVLTKIKFTQSEESAETANSDDTPNYQTRALNFDIMRDDTAAHNWKRRAEAQDSEADALAVIKAILGITAS